MRGLAKKERRCYSTVSMAIRECQVSFVDQRGIRHSVAVYASAVPEAASAGLKQIRETEMIGDDGVEDLTVDIKTTTSHKVPFFKLKAWLESSGRDPREAALKSKLR
jgi:hypothetical protein